MTMLDEALYYADKLGWPVFPLGEGSKIPLAGTHGFKDATTDAEQITAWWRGYPDGNIGVATGAAAQLVVLDLDGPEAKETIKQYAGGKLPFTPLAETPNGFHVFFQHPGQPVPNRVRMLPGLDLRGDGGYFVAAPSIVHGRAYSWVTPPEAATLAPLPEWIEGACLTMRDVHATGTGRASHLPPLPTGIPIPAGQRNDHLWRLGRQARWQGAVPNQIDHLLRKENLARCQPPLPESEMRRLIRAVVETPS